MYVEESWTSRRQVSTRIKGSVHSSFCTGLFLVTLHAYQEWHMAKSIRTGIQKKQRKEKISESVAVR